MFENDGVGTNLDAEFHEDDTYAENSNECEYTVCRDAIAPQSSNPLNPVP